MAEITSAQKLEFQEFVEKVKSFRGRHTELVTVLIPDNYNVSSVVKQLEGEKSTATNIKSRVTRNNVIEALEKIIRELKLGPLKYPKGIAIYCGNTSQSEGQAEIEFFSVEPIEELKTRIYRCDQTFVTEPLEEMLEIKEVYGLLVIERKEATIGILEGTTIKSLQHLTSGVPGKVRAGGQSSQRFHRITEGLAKEFFRRVAEEMKVQFFDNKRLKGILVGGPIPTKEEFLEEGQLVTKLKEKVIAVKDIGYSDDHGLKLLVEASQEDLAEQEIIKEKILLQRFFDTLGKTPEKAKYKLSEVKKALSIGAVETVILSKSTEKEIMQELSKTAEQMGTKVILVGEETDEGLQFKNLSGIGAILRFVI
ncbi:peptide chain release factor 1 [Candidatus Pacearchaeota archaeon]|nr:peptide chain release factor 1 [Candidatus Pacearchaeota archaeon]|tara:strand:- start:5536 stop:6633 length:1098 start_codon:yes stop_codon:yes gene_type:complete